MFTVKNKVGACAEGYKVKLVAKDFTQTYGINYEETFATVAKMNSTQPLLSLVENFGWPL